MPRKLIVGGLQRSGTTRTTIKKVAPPLVPEPNRLSGSSFSSGSQATSSDRSSCSSLGDLIPPSVDPNDYSRFGGQSYSSPTAGVHFYFPDSPQHPHPPSSTCQIVCAEVHAPGNKYATDVDQGIDVHGRDSPSGSSGGTSRHSISSLDSGRGSDSKRSVASSSASQPGPARHSSSSSLELLPAVVNVAEMVLHGVPDAEVLSTWLASLHFEEYVGLFLQAGYDMPTISRMTPEDLTAIGITKPNHRRKLKSEIGGLNISDGIPDYKPESLLTWLQLLRLEQYYENLHQQNYVTVDKVTELTWEDLEDIGIKKLGHQKKIMLAIKKIEALKKRSNQVNEMFSSTHEGLTPHSLGPIARPITLNTTLTSYHHLHGQEIAITTPSAKNSPSAETLPEFKTFQQSPTDCFPPLSPYHFYNLQTRATTQRGHSLDSLDDSVSTQMNNQHHDAWYDAVSGWRQYGYDTESDLGSNPNEPFIIHDGTASLHRPKGLIKPKPVAKIVAKSRPPDIDILKSLDIEGSNSKIGSNNPQQLYGTLRLKRNLPRPPKRTDSVKSESQVESRSIEAIKDEAFATCVKGLASRFSMTTREDELSYSRNNSLDFTSLSPSCEDSPLLCESAKDDVVEISKMTQRRKDSSDSLLSIASTDSNSLPFANENVGTIKQRSSKSYHPSLEASEGGMLRGGYGTDTGKEKPPESLKKVDVIDDIESMLVNLSHQLDAMLEEETTGHR